MATQGTHNYLPHLQISMSIQWSPAPQHTTKFQKCCLAIDNGNFFFQLCLPRMLVYQRANSFIRQQLKKHQQTLNCDDEK